MDIFIDEAWRGPLAGPVYVWLCCYTSNDYERPKYWDDIRDSKKLSEKRRENLYKKIKSDETFVTKTWKASAKTIENKWIIYALKRSIISGLWQIAFPKGSRYGINCLRIWLVENDAQLVIDGNKDFWLADYLGVPCLTVVRGDDTIKEIGIASICAKVERDRYMVKQAKKFPAYGFEKHKWYGTLYHRQMIALYGVSDIHRESWCKGCF